MKIIGSVRNETFIVTATRGELARVAGSSCARSSYSEDGPLIEVGATIDVGSMYDRLRSLRNAEAELAKAQQILRAVADLIEPIRPMIIEAQQEPDE